MKKQLMSEFGLPEGHFEQFRRHVHSRLSAALGADLDLLQNLRARNRWTDRGGNRHVLLEGSVGRRDQQHEVGGEVVWLPRLGVFRGHMWVRPEPREDWEYLMDARAAFRLGEYGECLRICGWIAGTYGDLPAFKRMRTIAESRCRTQS